MAKEIIRTGFPQLSQKEGRDYHVDGLDVVGCVLDIENYIIDNLSPEDKARGADENIYGILNYARDDFKVDHSPRVNFNRINAFLRKGELNPGANKRLGIIYFNQVPAGFDLINGSTGKIIISRETPTVRLSIPRIDFSGHRDKVITPSMVSKSLRLIADYIRSEDQSLDDSFVIGLTHLRMGSIARRWGFLLEEHPFTQEVYELLDKSIEDVMKEVYIPQDILQNLKAFRDQVLVYQTGADFINHNSHLGKSIPGKLG